MNTPTVGQRDGILAASLAAAAMIAFQVGSKATRDALFLSNLSITDLPVMVIVAAVFSLFMVIPATALMSRFGPVRVVPPAFIGSGLAMLGLWALLYANPRIAAIALYMVLSGMGAILISGFWSMVSEALDPRTARKFIGQIGAGATLGGLVGGLAAEWVGLNASLDVMLPILAGLQFVSAWQSWQFSRIRRETRLASHVGPWAWSPGKGLETVRKTPYLRNLSILVLLSAISAALLDYVMKSRAASSLTSAESLLQFFGLFYTGVSLLTFLVQTGLARRVLEQAGLARAVSTLPLTVVMGSIAGILVPGLVTSSVAKGSESVIQNSLFRSGYELLFNPVAADRKRATKGLIDVGFSRIGDISGGALIKLLLVTIPVLSSSVLLALAAAFSAVSLWMTSRLHKGYVQTLEKSLASHVVKEEEIEATDRWTKQTLMQSLDSLRLKRSQLQSEAKPGERRGERGRQEKTTGGEPDPETKHIALDPELLRIKLLRSGRSAEILRALETDQLPQPYEVPHLIRLLAWDEVAERVIHVLRRVASRATGQLTDAMLDSEADFTIRRRIPRVLVASDSERAIRGLFAALSDRRFEVRYQAGRAISLIMERNPEERLAPGEVFAAVSREVTVDRQVWESQRLLDQIQDGEDSPFEGEYLRERAGRSLEHVFTILSFALPREALMIAYRGIHTDDPHLRGTALEYLEIVLPEEIRTKLWVFLEDDADKSTSERTRDEVLKELIESNQSIEMNLKELRERGIGSDEEF